MAHSGIKLNPDLEEIAKCMNRCKSMKGFFMRLSENSVVPDLNDDAKEIDPCQVDGWKFEAGSGDFKEKMKTDTCFRKSLGCAFFEGDIVKVLEERFDDDTPKYAIIRVPINFLDSCSNRTTENLLFVTWAPDNCNVKRRMLIASTKENTYAAISKNIPQMQKVQLSDRGDIVMGELLNKCFKDGTAPAGVKEFDGKLVEQKRGKGYVYASCS